MANLIKPERARALCYSWHGGMWSPLYACASSGLVADPGALRAEVAGCLHAALQPGYTSADRRDLQALQRFLEARIVQAEAGARWPHHCAPWARAADVKASAPRGWTRIEAGTEGAPC